MSAWPARCAEGSAWAARLATAGLVTGATLAATASAGCGMCEPERLYAQPDAAAVETAPSAPATNLAPVVAAPPARPTRLCRVLVVDGEAATGGDAGARLAPGAQVPSDAWVVLAPKARLVIKHSVTSRELTFLGPARLRACVEGMEEVRLAEGTFESTTGSGEAPGAESWVVTPLGVARFSAASLQVHATVAEVKIKVDKGVGFVWRADDASSRGVDAGASSGSADEGWTRLTGGAMTLTPPPKLDAVAMAERATTKCTELARTARDLSRTLLERARSHAPDGPETAVQQVTSRRLARAACAVAELRAGVLAPSSAERDLAAELERARSTWSGLPEVPPRGDR